MKIIWQIDLGGIAKVKTFFDRYQHTPFVKKRITTNLADDKPSITKPVFWKRMVGCLLTTQQRSGPNTADSKPAAGAMSGNASGEVGSANPDTSREKAQPDELSLPKAEYKHVIALVHGICDIGAWHETVQNQITEPGIRVVQIRYGWFPAIRFLCPLDLTGGPVTRVLSRLNNLHAEYSNAKLSVIAHSFGTYVIQKVLRKDQNLQLWKLVFCGSVADDLADWAEFRRRVGDQVHPTADFVVNDCGTGDYWPVLAAAFGWRFGMAGATGFSEEFVTNRFHRGQNNSAGRHSLYFEGEFVKEYWKPFLVEDKPPQKGDGIQGEHLSGFVKVFYNPLARTLARLVALVVWVAVLAAFVTPLFITGRWVYHAMVTTTAQQSNQPAPEPTPLPPRQSAGGPVSGPMSTRFVGPPSPQRTSPSTSHRMSLGDFRAKLSEHYLNAHCGQVLAASSGVNRLRAMVGALLVLPADSDTWTYAATITDVIYNEYHPQSKTHDRPAFDGYDGPGGGKLNDWLTQNEEIMLSYSRVEGLGADKPRTAEWWVLCCGVADGLRHPPGRDFVTREKLEDYQRRIELKDVGLYEIVLVARYLPITRNGCRWQSISTLASTRRGWMAPCIPPRRQRWRLGRSSQKKAAVQSAKRGRSRLQCT